MDNLSRPVFSAGLALLLCLCLCGKAGAAPIEIPVMTQNLYVGADATAVLEDPSPATITAAYNSVVANNFPARAAAIATEAANAGGPLLIGLRRPRSSPRRTTGAEQLGDASALVLAVRLSRQSSQA
jgi:hypothetical protein